MLLATRNRPAFGDGSVRSAASASSSHSPSVEVLSSCGFRLVARVGQLATFWALCATGIKSSGRSLRERARECLAAKFFSPGTSSLSRWPGGCRPQPCPSQKLLGAPLKSGAQSEPCELRGEIIVPNGKLAARGSQVASRPDPFQERRELIGCAFQLEDLYRLLSFRKQEMFALTVDT